MIFSSYAFLFVFLPITFCGFALLTYFKNEYVLVAWLVGASLLFYGYWNPPYLLLLLLSTGCNYAFGKAIHRATQKRKMWMVIAVGLNLALLGYFKYANFFVANLNAVLHADVHLQHIFLPLGISFFTFQQIAYIVDVYQRKAEQTSLMHYCLFVSFFPQLIAGPIVHHKEMLPQFTRQNICSIQSKNIAIGLTILLMGFCKKTVIADSLAPFANSVFLAAKSGTALTFYQAWGGALTYTMQLYFDFSGYIDMAIGMALLFGIHLPLNFNSPYKALNIPDFWRRWHMTLSRFIRDYLYIPLGGNRGNLLKRSSTLIITMTLSGLWHGAGWTFIFWGLLHGFYMVVHHCWHALRREVVEYHSGIHMAVSVFSRWFLTFLAITIGWVFFRSENFASAWSLLSTMFSTETLSPLPYIHEFGLWWAKDIAGIRVPEWIYGMFWLGMSSAIAFTAPNTQQIMQNVLGPFYEKEHLKTWSLFSVKWRPTLWFALLGAVITVMSIVFLTLYQEREFLYFQF
ncbi:membrane-bound O-acyltransferase family protein [Candidatus Peregrinibacteria bacterium CG10_big_fil_rev_8_21_14_0_10_49_10]|nr:MAG: membrane-bound O-acyltransferase family protein [Candidatus Peregrinibacteria bacterium CG10_big_fil_rev_8_21_14_0_10_49_10]